MGLFDKVAAHRADQADNSKPKTVFRSGGRNKWGSDATAHFKKMAEQGKKEKIAKKMNSVLGDENYKYIRKDGKTVGFERD